MLRHPYATLFSPLVLFGWFLWPDPLAFTFTGVCRALFSAYALFFTATGLAGLLASTLGKGGQRWELAGVFLVSAVVSLSIGLTWQADAAVTANVLTRQLGDALLDAVWCTVSAVVLMHLREMPLRR